MSDNVRWMGTILIVVLLIYSGKGDDVAPVPPQPPVIVSPIPEPGLHLLAISETMSLTPQLAAVLNSPGWQKLIPAGNWRVYDPDADMSRDAPKWQAAMQRPRTSLPWVIVSDHPNGGYEGPLPATLAELVALIKRVDVP